MSLASRLKFVSRSHHVEQSRHLLRALLREATYLPDPVSQDYIKKYLIYRFRNASSRASSLLRQTTSSSDESVRLVAQEELQKALRKGYKGLHQLIRANEGEVKPLMRVLRHTYGRTGPRRYESLRHLLVPDVDFRAPNIGPAKPIELKSRNEWAINTVPVPAVLVPPSSVKGDTMVYKLSPQYSKLHALATSQTKRSIVARSNRIRTQFSIPTKNTWGRSMPRKRVKNMVQQKYAGLLDAIMTPLSEKEWLRLRGLALGTTPWEGCKPRRKRLASCPVYLSASDLEKLAHLSDDFGERRFLPGDLDEDAPKSAKILAAVGDGSVRGYWGTEDAWLGDEDAVNQAIDSVLEEELQVVALNKTTTGGRHRGHNITPRFMRRLWMEIFRTCPMMQWDETKKMWNVTWGSEKQADAEKKAVLPDARLRELFGLKS